MVLAAGLIALVVWAAPRGSGHEGHAGHGQQAAAKKAVYQCPMHPSYTSDLPGECPICGMDLVLVKEEQADTSAVRGRATVSATPEKQRLIGLKLGTVEKKPFTKTIRAVGRVEYNERLLSAVNQKFAGWVERLHVSAVGDVVGKGAPLFEIYSPELVEAQLSYLVALDAWKRAKDQGLADAASFAGRNMKSARERLLRWDIAEEQIQALETAKEPPPRTPILAKVQGVVTKRNIVLGAYVQPGADLYEIADLTTVWVRADVYAYEMPDLKVGAEAEVRLPSLPGEPLTGRVVYVYPYLNEQTRTVSIRLEVPNGDGRLKPGLFANVTLRIDLGEQLTLDDQAILDSGTRQIVFVQAGEGRFVPQEVVVGARSDGRAVILKGLYGGERIVVSGNFLVDSESRLKAALKESGAAGGHQHGKPETGGRQ